MNHYAFPSKQVAVVSCPYQLQTKNVLVHLVDQQPVRLNMALAHILVVPGVGQLMVPILLRQRFLRLHQTHYRPKPGLVTASLDRQFEVLLELARKLKFKNLYS